MFLLVDCNNFFVSCERVFRPALRRRPVAVLSNNDGCMVSRSNEVKALGIPMGAPAWKYRSEVARHGITLFSGNFALYGDFSRRVMSVIGDFSDSYEQYSIDEAFIEVNNFSRTQLAEYAHQLRNTILQWTGIPVSIGVAPTKTLAKVANVAAKKDEASGNVHLLCTPQEIDEQLAVLPVRGVWGIGRAMEQFLHDYSITTAKQLADTPDAWIQKHMHKQGIHLVWELRGISCGGIEEWSPRKGILSSRSFGKPVNTLADLRQSVAHHVSIAAEKLREQGSVAQHLYVFIATNRFKPELTQYSGGTGVQLVEATAHTPTLIAAAERVLADLYKPGLLYKKAGVWLTDIGPQDLRQASVFGQAEYTQRQQRLMSAQDQMNAKWGSRTVYSLAAGTRHGWSAKQQRRSPRYTTVWSELPWVKAV